MTGTETLRILRHAIDETNKRIDALYLEVSDIRGDLKKGYI
ncbi:hypothetical protein A45J_0459 [hot springs metagenome]|uniref:Uncharacterized protein n=1 Tax=hot springs metagenome TaxID=433727 RepID=A0A5J4KU06_9ZZZZ